MVFLLFFSLKTGLFKWKPDFDGAAFEYSKAGNVVLLPSLISNWRKKNTTDIGLLSRNYIFWPKYLTVPLKHHTALLHGRL